jgi:cytochrome c oxidase cbb3-type subunit 3
VSNERQDVVLGHAHEADGIEEYDNKLPTWWVGLFFGCVVWAGAYLAWFHFVADTSQAKMYQEEVAAAALAWPAPTADQALAAAATPEAIEEGRKIYMANCVACHGPEMKGGIGPDLTDATWIHGGALAAIQKTVSEGVPAKGMLSWGPILGPQKVAQVSAFVHSSGGGQ